MSAVVNAIQLDGVDAYRQKRLALERVSLGIPKGTVASVVGPNGAGKSTFLGLVSGRFKPARGQVRVEGTVSEVLQGAAIDEQMPLTVQDVVRQGRYGELGFFKRMGASDRRIVDEAIDRVGMTDHRRTPISELSGGQRQRALVAQGLAQRSDVLLLDEPMAGVDLPTQRRLSDVIDEVADRGTTVVYSTHSVADASRSDLMVALCCACICCAPVDEALENPAVIELFNAPVDTPGRQRLR